MLESPSLEKAVTISKHKELANEFNISTGISAHPNCQ